jgi:hypothetical protein
MVSKSPTATQRSSSFTSSPSSISIEIICSTNSGLPFRRLGYSITDVQGTASIATIATELIPLPEELTQSAYQQQLPMGGTGLEPVTPYRRPGLRASGDTRSRKSLTATGGKPRPSPWSCQAVRFDFGSRFEPPFGALCVPRSHSPIAPRLAPPRASSSQRSSVSATRSASPIRGVTRTAPDPFDCQSASRDSVRRGTEGARPERSGRNDSDLGPGAARLGRH